MKSYECPGDGIQCSLEKALPVSDRQANLNMMSWCGCHLVNFQPYTFSVRWRTRQSGLSSIFRTLA
jgi:hypothetical protein